MLKVFEFLMSAFGALFARSGVIWARRLALMATSITALALLATTMFAAILALIAQLTYVVSDTVLWYAIQLFFPPHAAVCVAIYFSARQVRWVYDKSVNQYNRFLKTMMY